MQLFHTFFGIVSSWDTQETLVHYTQSTRMQKLFFYLSPVTRRISRDVSMADCWSSLLPCCRKPTTFENISGGEKSLNPFLLLLKLVNMKATQKPHIYHLEWLAYLFNTVILFLSMNECLVPVFCLNALKAVFLLRNFAL